MGNDLRQMAEELLLLGALRDTVNNEYRHRAAALQAQYEQLGLERQRITTVDGTEFGTVVLANAVVTVEVCDHKAMVTWLRANNPDELVEDINPAYWRSLVETAKRVGVGMDPHTNQRLDWIRVTVGNKTLRGTTTREAKQAVRALIQRQGVQMELEAPE